MQCKYNDNIQSQFLNIHPVCIKIIVIKIHQIKQKWLILEFTSQLVKGIKLKSCNC